MIILGFKFMNLIIPRPLCYETRDFDMFFFLSNALATRPSQSPWSARNRTLHYAIFKVYRRSYGQKPIYCAQGRFFGNGAYILPRPRPLGQKVEKLETFRQNWEPLIRKGSDAPGKGPKAKTSSLYRKKL